MKAKLFICGAYQGEIEVGDNSLVAKLARFDWAGVADGVRDLQTDIDEITAIKPERDRPPKDNERE